MSWKRFFRKEPKAAQTASSERARPAGSARPQPLSGYGANPYDTYTWELHADGDGERGLKRAHLIDKPKEQGESCNPYDTGKFNGSW